MKIKELEGSLYNNEFTDSTALKLADYMLRCNSL